VEGFEDCMLVDAVFSGDKKIEVYLDSDTGITLQKCQRISRMLESKIEESGMVGEKYILEVSSPGAKRPMKLLRQYHKHIGRNLKIKMKDGTEQTGKLSSVQANEIILEQEKKVKKKKEKLSVPIEFQDIESAVVTLKF
jgi:ribosome maturation factor RimP